MDLILSSFKVSKIAFTVLIDIILSLLLLISICDFLEIDDIYNNLIYYIQWYIKIKYPLNITYKIISIYEIVEVINSMRFIRNTLNIRINDDFMSNIVIKHFIPNLGQIDVSPVILLLGLWFIKLCMQMYLRPIIF